MKFYKVVSANLMSQDGGDFDWSDYAPTENGPGKWTPEVDPAICKTGYHVTPYPCMWIQDGSRIFEVETKGDPVREYEVGTYDKAAFLSVRLVRELTNQVATDGNTNSGSWNSGNTNSGSWNSGNWNSGDMNSGSWNSGNRNSGSWNSGNRNSGSWNSGNRNSGSWNSGNWNSGDMNSGNWNSGSTNSGSWNSGNWNSGYLNTTSPETVRVFNRDLPREEWERAEVPDFFHFELVSGGYKASWHKAWETATEEDRAKLFELPNFDADVWFDLTGIDVRSQTNDDGGGKE